MNKLQYAYEHNILTDLKLTIDDGQREITINVHRIILFMNCIYFEKLFMNCKEQFQNEITINVSNAYVCYDIIMSFYGLKTNIGELPEWLHLLESIKCYDYLGLKFDTNLLRDVEVPMDGFELLLDIANLTGNATDITKVITKNIPYGYDLMKLDGELIKKLVELNEDKIITGHDNDIKIWNSNTGQLLNTLCSHTDRVRCICTTYDNCKIISGSYDKTIKIWDMNTGVLMNTLNGHTSFIISVCVTYDNKKIIAGDMNHDIKIWDHESGKLLSTLQNHADTIMSLCVSSDNKKLISGSCDTTIKIWDINTQTLLMTLHGHIDAILSVCVSFDNKIIISGGDDMRVNIWGFKTGKLLNTFKDHIDYVRSVCISSDNKKIVSGSDDKSIIIRDIVTQKLLLLPHCHTGWIRNVCISPDNKRIISGGDDANIKMWDIETGILLNTIVNDDPITSLCVSKNNNELVEKLKKLIN